MSLDVHVQSDNLQLVLVLPAKKIFLRAMAIKYNLNPHLTHTVNIKNITGWVPSPSFDDKWEELARLNSWNIVIQPRSALGAGVMVEAMGKGARLRIPYKFIFSDLVTDVAVSIKATKHLATTSFAKQFVPMAKPPVEDAKRVPLINLHVECLIVEAADDPFESRLNMIWRAGLVEHRARIERDQAFSAKVEAIKAAEEGRQSSEVMTSDGRQGGVSPAHSISIQEAKDRLGLYNAQRWVQVHKLARDKLIAHEESVAYRIRDPAAALVQYTMPPFEVYTERASPPVIRAVLDNVGLHLKQAQFEDSTFADFMNELGGIPRETEYTLLIPLHLTWAMDSAQITIRDYPLPLLSITGCEKAWECSTNLVIAEEVGGDATVDWIPCRISSPTVSGHQDTFSFFVPKTVNPVKTYADPRVTVRTTEVTDIAWGVSYNPPLQDVMRVIDTLSTAPRDKSPSIGFWDKLRLVLHWKVLIEFDGEVHVHLKGSRDPYQISGTGAGFVLCFDGNTKLTVGHSWQDRELIQLSSDRTLLAIPDLKHFEEGSSASSVDQESLKLSPANPFSRSKRKLAKICAKLTNGVRLGLGFILERTCGPECRMCRGKSAFSKRCRFFNFKPHYKVELSATPPWESAIRLLDSYAGFRSDFIHFSLSLTSPTSPDNSWKDAEGRPLGYNIFHLTPKAFSHFFAWWELFNGAVSLPIRQGKRWPSARPLSPKFGRHLATIKYRFSLSPLFISHTYKQDLKEQWREGETGAVGIKVMAETFKADLHQREQEIHVIDPVTGLLKKTTHKPFYAAEVSLTNIEARAVSALFSDPRKALVPLFQAKHENFESQPAGPTFPEKSCLDLSSKWFDIDDFSETDWVPTDRNPRVWMFQAAHCPRFTFFSTDTTHTDDPSAQKAERIQRSMDRLETYIESLSAPRTKRPAKQPAFSGCAPFDAMPRDSFSSVMSLEDWSEFTNVYEVHSPTVILSNSTRNILLTYYYSSRNRRAFEYHMSARAVKFIREQAKTELRRSMESTTSSNNEPSKVQSAAARAANTLLKMLIYEGSEEKHEKHEKHERQDSVPSVEQSSLASNLVPKKSHFCLLMKPQIALHCEEGEDAVVFLAAMEASWQSHAILDMEYIDDPVNGYIMSRNNVKLRGLQAFVPVELGSVSSFDQVPLEVLVDYKCESAEYERLVPHTDASILYDKFNRLRLHSKVSSNTSGPLLDTDSSNEHLKYQADRIIVDIPRFAITANSKSFNSLQTIITHLLLYTDPIHALRNEALEEFLFTYDSFSDFSSAAEVVSTLQGRIRNLMRISNKYDLIFDQLSESGQMDALTANAHLTALSDELAFIFEAIRLAQEKARNFDDDLSSALRLDVKSDLISWNMLGPYSDLLAKLTVKNTSFTWTNRKDCTTTNQLIIGDLQALNGSPDTAFPEILTAYPHPSSHPMVKKKLFATAEWIVLPPVGQISIVEKLEIKMHPVKVQIERKVGREIQEYISPKAKRVKAGDNHRPAHHHHHAHHHTLSHGSTKGDSTSTSTSQHLSSSIDTFGTSSQATIPSSVPASMENSLSLSVPSIDHSPVNLASPHEGTFQQPRSLSRARSKSSNNLREEAQGGSLVASTGALPITGVDSSARTATRGLRRAKSSTNLASRSGTGDDSGTDSVVGPVTFAPGTNDAPASSGAAAHSHAVGHKKPKPQRLTSETAEMRARAQKRTFISVELHGFLIVLTYKGEPLNLGRRGDQGGIRARDLVPDVQDFQLAFPKFEHKNCTWSVEEFLADVKSELMKNAFGMVFKAFNARLTAKYRHNDPGQTPAIRFKELDDEDTRHKQSSQSTPPHPPLHRFFSSKHRNPAPTPQPPPQPSFDTKNSPSKSKSTSRGSGDSSAPSSWSNAILSETEVLTSSPTSKKVPLPRLDPSETSLGSTSTTGGSEKPRGRVLKKLFRRPHSHRESTDSSTSNISSGAPRTSLDVPGDTLRNETTSRSRSTVR
ncbi:hypothetical protein FRC02_005895 [Tulasnella sp. 418]|nr:hypothetical protein FRC02_005895 [Tulasnella sp. 418]